jgi:three-Cys-motif partner protein
MSTKRFFEESREQSLVKATIVEKYFDAWAKIIIGAQKASRRPFANKIGYVDLFAGPGRYRDGADSTPLRVLQHAIKERDLRERLVTIFNDKDEENVRALEGAINELPGIERLKTAPDIWNEEVGDGIAAHFASINTIPILAFIDPWGYKGLTLRLVDAFLKNWGCDCIFFFNYGRINAGLSNPLVREHMAALFGDDRACRLERELKGMSPAAREATVVNELAQALKTYGHRFVLPFCFKNDKGTRTSHHLILVTKHFKGYEVMKDIMASSSSASNQGVSSFTYSPADSAAQTLLFEFNRPLDDLRELLLSAYAGRRLTMREIYEEHSVDRPFISRNYKTALRQLEDEGLITTLGRKSTVGFANDLVAVFPRRR